MARRWNQAFPAGQRQHGLPLPGLRRKLLAPLSGAVRLCRLQGANSNHRIVYLALFCIYRHQKLTTGPHFPMVCRQSSVSFINFTLIQFLSTIRITSFHTNFLLSRPHSPRSPQHSTLIYPAVAGKLTTEPRGRAFRRQFLPISRKHPLLEWPSRIFVKATIG